MRVYLTIQKSQPLPQGLRKLWQKAAKITIEQAADFSLPKAVEISLLINDLADMQALNLEYRNLDKPTDVLSFPLWQADEQPLVPPDGILPLGDIIICWDYAQNQAAELGHSIKREAVFLFIHGLLHLLGYDHELSAEDEQQMFGLQEQIMAALKAELKEDFDEEINA